MSTRPCRDCHQPVSLDAYTCPRCGAPRPASPKWDGWGFEYQSTATLLGLPLLHVSFKYRNFRPVVARGVIAIGQFGVGIFTVAQFGVGVFSVGQFTAAVFALAQFAAAYRAIAQIALVINQGTGQLIYPIADLIGTP